MKKQQILLLAFGFITFLILLFPPFIFKDTELYNNDADPNESKIIPSYEKYDLLFLPDRHFAIKDLFENHRYFRIKEDGFYLYRKKNTKVLKIEEVITHPNYWNEKDVYTYYDYTVWEPNLHLMERHVSLTKFLGALALDFFIFGFIAYYFRKEFL
jgi:hypothetical protein